MNNTAKHIFYIVLGSLAILLVPLIAMNFTDQVKWEAGDFLFGFVFFVVLGLTFELGVKKLKNKTARLAVGAIVILAFLALWAELAVGIFD